MVRKGMDAVILVGLAIAMAVTYYAYVVSIDSPSKAVLLKALLAVLAIVGAWLASRYYSEWNFKKNLRDFAMKDAERVDSLSDQLDKLSVYLQQGLNSGDYPSPGQQLMAKDLRMEAAIHIIQTLKSVNDRSLNEWGEVIGEVVSAHREDRERKEEHLRDLVDRLEALAPGYETDLPALRDGSSSALQSQMDSIRSEVRLFASQMGVPVRLAASPSKPEGTALAQCPSCGSSIEYRQQPKTGTVKSVRCPTCDQRLLSTFDGTSFTLDVRRNVRENVTCLKCGIQYPIELGNWLGAITNSSCPSCGLQIKITRSRSGANVKAERQVGPPMLEPPSQLPSEPDMEPGDLEELMAKVRQGLPPQPWPKGMSRKLARELGLAHSQVNRIISELIRRGEFKPQVDGKMYVPVKGDEEWAAQGEGAVKS